MKLKQASDILFELAKPFKTDQIEWRAQRVAKDNFIKIKNAYDLIKKETKK